MFVRRTALVSTLALVVAAATAQAQSSATQTVTYSVSAINDIDLSGDPGALTVSSATNGVFDDVTDATTSYAITTNESNKKITAAINTDMPTGVSLQVSLAAPAGATSAGAVTLSTTAQDVVTGITQVNEAGKTITYTLSATAAAGAVTSATKTVTFTIVAGV